MLSNENGNEKSSFMTGEEVVISGISGVFPSSDDVVEFMDNLYNKVDMVSKSQSRWDFKHSDLPKYGGRIKGVEKFDAQFFRVHYKQAAVMELVSRKLLEHAYGAIYDAGINPISLKNSRVGIFIASTLTGSENVIAYEEMQNDGLSLSGRVKAMYANRISYWLDSKGPSYVTDLGCASALVCLQHAYRSINAGECEAAIVGGGNFCNHPVVSINLRRCGLLCLDGKTKCFDKNGDGYVRSDAVNVLFLQKAKHAKRIYCEVYNVQGCYSMSTNDKFLPIREESLIKKFLEDFYSNIAIDPDNVEYVECSGVGIAQADSNELEAIGHVHGRRKPVKVGSVKSNMGNSETASGLCSLTKLCLAYHTGQLSANLHYNEPFDISSVQSGSVQVLTDNTDFSRGFTALNSFSFTGTTYHALLKGHYKEKINDRYKSQIPYLILTSGRQENWMIRKLNLLKCHPLDPEVIGLLHNIYQTDTPQHVYRGFAILDADYRGRVSSLAESVAYYNNKSGPVVFVYSGTGASWSTLSLELMKVPIFAQSMQKSHKILQSKGFDLMSLLTEANVTNDVDFMDLMIGITAVQIAFTDLLYEMGIVPDYIIGHSMGDIICSYADGSLSAEQVLISNYIRTKFWNDIPFMHGAMVTVGLGYEKLKGLCPPGIEVVCYNSPKSTTVTGPCDATRRFAEELRNSNICIKEIECRNIPLHSKYISHTESSITKLLEEVITDPKPRSPKWLSTSIPERLWNTGAAKFSSAEYHTRNLLGPVFFEEAARHIPEDAIIIDIAPHGQTQLILKQCYEESTHISLSKLELDDPVKFLLEAIGRLYEVGLKPNVSVLYPTIEYPVSTTTPLLSHLIEWEHSEDWPTNEYKPKKRIFSKSQTFIISIQDDDYKYIQGNIRDGKNVFPEASLLLFVWNTAAMYYEMDYEQLSVVFDEVHFHEEVIIDVMKILRFCVVISKGNNKFEVTLENKLIVSGIIHTNVDCLQTAPSMLDINEDLVLTKRDVYKVLQLRGYSYKGDFRSIESTTIPVRNAQVVWIGEWATFLDSLFQLNILTREHNGVSILKYIHKITIDVKENNRFKQSPQDHITCCHVYVNINDGVTRCGGVVLENVIFLDKTNEYILEVLRDIKDSISTSYVGLPILRNELNGNVYDYSGINKNLDRVMGVVYTANENNSLIVDPDLIWPVPEHWSLEDAVTVPLPYLYAFYCLTMKYNLRKHNSVLITDGVKPLGQAVISLCLALECTVFTTVTNVEDKLFLLKLFPNLQENNIGNSEDGSFLDIIKCNTKQEGCDLVINGFSGILKKLATQCVKKFGLFMVINTIDNNQDTDFEISCLDLNRIYQIVDLPSVFKSINSDEKKTLQRIISESIAKGMVRPLSRVVFKSIDEASTFQKRVSDEKCKGRIVVSMVDVDNHIDNISEGIGFEAKGNYVIVCDDSELGIELAEYLIKRGVKKIILHTALDGFVQFKLRYWEKLNASVEVCFENLVNKDGCERLLQMRESGIIEGIFILNNCEYLNNIVNTTSNFESDFKSTNILHNLNDVSKHIIGLRYFVILSYVSKDDFENNLLSTCDMICEERRKSGLPALHYLTGLLNNFDESNGIQLNVHSKINSNVFKDLEKSINSNEIKINALKTNGKRERKCVDDIEKEMNNRLNIGFGMFYKYIENDEMTEIFVNMVTKIHTVNENEQQFDSSESYLLMIPGFDGNCHVFASLCERLKMPAVALQLTPDLNYHSMKTIASDLMKLLKKQIDMKSKFYILGYSFGVNVALELASLFEQEGHTGVVYCLDSSPDALRIQFQEYVGELSHKELQDVFLNHMYFLFTKEYKDINFENMKWSNKVQRVLDNIKLIPFSNEYKKLVIETAYKKTVLALGYEPDFKLESELILIKGIPHLKATNLVDDYNLSKYTKHPIKIFEINSDFATAPEDCRIVDIVNKALDPVLAEELKKTYLCESYML